jgi:hypothetical protein
MYSFLLVGTGRHYVTFGTGLCELLERNLPNVVSTVPIRIATWISSCQIHSAESLSGFEGNKTSQSNASIS